MLTSFKQYQARARETAIYPSEYAMVYPLLGLVGEVGEFCNKYKKVIRDGKPFSKDDAQSELGDILWYVAAVASDFGLSLDEVAYENLAKLSARKDRGVIGGSGDKR